ncbi:VOC family protein [Terrimonas sp. NA20]|uniref:VOC family protein n=1 Tax=Terrimonas ginsenosidimutans TaxID=2908004 RepID=A0ABS9KMG3_9BACT|nr:VOC family protein [Terrimonas ginsenosidimutans]MCG2613512.1 VOC family protein [Terrimonas ginsenosidimutans]
MQTSSLILEPYLFFGGNCRQAMEFYNEIFGGKLELSTFGEAPAGAHGDSKTASAETKDLIMHARLSGPFVIMASDNPEHPVKHSGQEFSLSISGTDKTLLEGYFSKLSQAGKITLPLSRQFWGPVFGMLTDQFGINWMISIQESR